MSRPASPRARTIRILALWLAIALFALLAVSAGAHRAIAQSISGKTPTPRPTPLADDERKREVRRMLEDPGLAGSDIGILVRPLTGGKTRFRHDSNKLLIPASTNKIVTGAMALDALGPKYRFKTDVLLAAPLSADGTVNGDLFVKGMGDPSISVEDAWLLARQIVAHGVRRVTGDLVGDDTYFEPVRFYDSWGFKRPLSYAAPMGALSFNWNTVQAYVVPGRVAGEAAHVQLNPESEYFALDNQVTTCEDCNVVLTMSLVGRRAVVAGKMPPESRPWTTFGVVEEPTIVAMHALKAMLVKEGVVIDGVARAGEAPEGARRLLRHESKDLSLILRYLFRYSNNFVAEQVLKTAGAELFGAPGSREKASQAAIDFLKRIDAYKTGITVDDGSGLSRVNRQSAASLVGVLQHMATRPEIFPEFVEALAIGGIDGTLENRFNGTHLENRVRAKTGYLFGAITLAGYAWDVNNEPFAFAILINNPPPKTSVRDVRRRMDKILLTLMS
ncbi:D-alanyl-D-alanine carboxypeptidase/D-alanyl-D-alanine-endopeptidase [bacterium]|nr:D-alanyl-D-alanine carboxypeptidase/D-alanyl-D-alanine-endopeptidase [bacterium]